MAEQFKVWIPIEKRIAGHIYDVHSGMDMGLASYEQQRKWKHLPFKDSIAGCPHTLQIHFPQLPNGPTDVRCVKYGQGGHVTNCSCKHMLK